MEDEDSLPTPSVEAALSDLVDGAAPLSSGGRESGGAPSAPSVPSVEVDTMGVGDARELRREANRIPGVGKGGAVAEEPGPATMEEAYAFAKGVEDGLRREEVRLSTDTGSIMDLDMYVVATPEALRPFERSIATKHGAVTSVVLVSDVDGWGDASVRRIADEIAFVTNGIVAVPDLFNGKPFR